MEPDLPDIESLYDFFYIDQRRISLYLAQLDPNGKLTGIKASTAKTNSMSLEVKGSFAVLGGKGVDVSNISDSIERHYDPAWALPITVMDRLDELGFINRSLTKVHLGQIFLGKVYMKILDLRMLKDMWPTLMEHAIRSETPSDNQINNRSSRRSQQSRKTAKDDYKFIADVLQKFPHSIQTLTLNQDGFLWGTLAAENLIAGPEDFGLKHGAHIPGEWYSLCIIDSYPAPPIQSDWSSIVPMGFIGTNFPKVAEEIRKQVGRPENAFGVTPLAIFRMVRVNATDTGADLMTSNETDQV